MSILLLCLVLVSVSGCDGVLSNHYASRAHEPLDGTYGNSRFDSNDVSYTQGNLEYLNNKNNRNNKIYYASAQKYNDINYNIAKEYISNYQKFLKVDAKELENCLRNEQYEQKSDDILKKMEAGILPKRPMNGNIEIMQTLKDEKNKIAFPDYMDEYLVVYNNKRGNVIKDVSGDTDSQNHTVAYNLNSRDDYVNYYFNMINGSIDGKDTYKEKVLE